MTCSPKPETVGPRAHYMDANQKAQTDGPTNPKPLIYNTLFSSTLFPSMATDHEAPSKPQGSSAPRWDSRRKRSFPRRKRLPVIRLGGGPAAAKQRRGPSLVRLMRRIKLRWLKLRYFFTLKKLKQYYRSMVKDFVEAGATLETFQQRILMETSFAVPVLGVSFSTYPSAAGGAGAGRLW